MHKNGMHQQFAKQQCKFSPTQQAVSSFQLLLLNIFHSCCITYVLFGQSVCTRFFCILVFHQSVLLSIPLNSIFQIQKLKAILHTHHSFAQLHSSFVGLELKWYNILEAEVSISQHSLAQQHSSYCCLVSLGWQEQRLDQHESEDEVQAPRIYHAYSCTTITFHSITQQAVLVVIVVVSYCLDGRHKFQNTRFSEFRAVQFLQLLFLSFVGRNTISIKYASPLPQYISLDLKVVFFT